MVRLAIHRQQCLPVAAPRPQPDAMREFPGNAGSSCVGVVDGKGNQDADCLTEEKCSTKVQQPHRPAVIKTDRQYRSPSSVTPTSGRFLESETTR